MQGGRVLQIMRSPLEKPLLGPFGFSIQPSALEIGTFRGLNVFDRTVGTLGASDGKVVEFDKFSMLPFYILSRCIPALFNRMFWTDFEHF